MALSPLQKKIMQCLFRKNAVMYLRDLLPACFGKLSRRDERRRYQAAWASLSRAVTRLENDGLVVRWHRIIRGGVGVGLTDQGRRAVNE